jgi:hypothetical protein
MLGWWIDHRQVTYLGCREGCLAIARQEAFVSDTPGLDGCWLIDQAIIVQYMQGGPGS